MEKKERTLKKPHFFKIKDIKPGIHCYNIYGVITKLTREETMNNRGETVVTVNGVITDETASANFRLKNENANKVKEGETYAFRNGKSNVVQDHILLELDKFGKVSHEP